MPKLKITQNFEVTAFDLSETDIEIPQSLWEIIQEDEPEDYDELLDLICEFDEDLRNKIDTQIVNNCALPDCADWEPVPGKNAEFKYEIVPIKKLDN